MGPEKYYEMVSLQVDNSEKKEVALENEAVEMQKWAVKLQDNPNIVEQLETDNQELEGQIHLSHVDKNKFEVMIKTYKRMEFLPSTV